MSARREPLLWIQLLAIGIIPLELLLLRLILAGADLGPIPTLERITVWILAVLTPTISLLKRPADWASLILVKLPTNKRSKTQLQLSNQQKEIIPQAALIIGAIVLLIIFWRIDTSAVIVNHLSPLKDNSRLSILFTSIPLLAIITWQWHQLSQSIWLLSKSPNDLLNTPSISEKELKESRLCLGLGILSINQLSETPSDDSVSIEPEQSPEEQNSSSLISDINSEDEAIPIDSQPNTLSGTPSDDSVSIEPEQSPEEQNSSSLISDINSEDEAIPIDSQPNTLSGTPSDDSVSIEPEQSPEEQNSTDLD